MAQSDVIYKCETLKTYDVKDPRKTCVASKVASSCFSMVQKTGWQCFESEAEAAATKCSEQSTPDGGKYDGACVYARDFTFWGKPSGSHLAVKEKHEDESAASSYSMAGLTMLAVISANVLWQ